MLNVSSAFKQLLYEGKRNYLSYADITLSDGTKLSLDNSDIWDSGMEISDSVSSDNSFDVGAAIVNSSKIVINNIYDDYSDCDFSNAEVIMYVGLKLPDGTIERVRKGTFHVDEPKYNGAIITLNCLDNMSKFDRPYSESTLQYPATLNQIVRDACSKCGVTLQTYDFPHDDYVVQERPEDEATTFGEVIQWASQIACCFCRCDAYGRLELKWYNQEAFENRYFLSGGTFKNIPPTNDTVSGGAFNPWTDGELINSGGFTDLDGIHHIYSLGSISTSTDDVVITGVSVSVKASDDDSGQEIVVSETGASGYVISIENNNLINVGDGATVAGWIGEKLIGFRFRKASVSHLSDPTIEAGDVAILTDTKGRNYNIIISSTKFNSNGSYQNTESSALDPARNSATRFSESTKNYVDYRKEIKREKTRREQAIEELTNRINNSSGTFTTIETQADGSHIYYLHNKPALADSDIIWKMTAEAWGVSTDGGKTYNAGMTVDGDTIVRILTATGVNADWIDTGAIQVTDDDGSIIFSVDMDTRRVIISGDHVRIGGKTATAAIDDVLQESKDYSDGKLADFADTVTEDLSSIQAQVDGQIETYYEDYEPSLQNYPANEWTTTEERKKHEGDLFYWKSKGYAYRFFQDGATWKWQLVQDTDITQAMAAAEKAQDTADGKRRVFVIPPTPPYDIGDLWTTGEEILTCSVARAQGSTYVSTDWKKLNSYTDDTVANEALEEARKARNLNMILDNEYQGIYTDHNGNIATFPNVKTTVQVLYGHTDVSANCSYTTNKSSGVTGTWNNASRTYTVTGLSTDTGWVDITASYLSLFVVTKRFNIEKIKGGTNGSNGVSVTGTTITYQASSSGTSIPKGNWSPSVPTVSAGRYLWTRTQFNYSNGNHTYSYSVSRMGQNGTDGNDGKGIKSSNTTYQASTSGTSVPTGNWSSSIPTVSAGQYLWTRTIFQYTDGTTSTSYSVGKMGQNGTPARIYMIEPSVNILKRSKDDTISPNFVEFKSYYRDGNSATRTAYNGRWIIEETSDGDTWTTIYTSSANENSVTHYVYSLLADSDGSAIANANGDTIGIPRDVVAIRAKLYAAGGTTNLLDMQSVAVVIDVDNLTHEEIFNLLTNNGAVKGIYQEGDQLYISFTYAKGGELVLGGANNGNGIFILRNKSGAEIARMDNSGFSTTNGNFSGTITGSKISGSELDTNSASGSIGINVNAGEFAFFSQGQKVANISSMLMLTGSDGVTRRGVAVRQESDSNFISFGALGIDIIPSQEYPIQMKSSTSVGGKLYAYFGAEIAGYLEVNGTKNRVINTKNYGKRLQYSYEMASPLFGDIGEGIINEKGECIVCIDDIFQETAKTSIEYQVFLQKEGEGDIWVEEKNEQYFTVKGTPDLKFAWEIKARQKDYESERLCVSHSDSSDGIIERQDYEYSGINRYFELTQEYLENSFFDAQKYISEMEDMFI